MKKNKKNILVITTSFPRWLNDFDGLFIYDLSKRLVNSFNIFILAPHYPKAKISENWSGLKVHRFRYFLPIKWQGLCGGAPSMLANLKSNKLLCFQLPSFMISYFLNLKRIVEKEDINIIYAHWIIPQAFIAVLYKKLFRKKDLKIICTSHGIDAFALSMFNFLKRWVINNINSLVAVSNDIKNKIISFGIEKRIKIDVIPMGVNDGLFRLNKYDQEIKLRFKIKGPFLLFVGRLVEKKGVTYLLSAMPEVIKKYPDTKLLIIGCGPLKDDLEKQSKELNIQDNVMFVGAVQNQDLPKYYATADIFIGPSISEGFGLVFVEAMLSKTAVISSDLAAISDIVKNNKTGIQCNVKNTKNFSREILSLIQGVNKRNFLAENGYNYVKDNFTWDIITKKYSKILNQ